MKRRVMHYGRKVRLFARSRVDTSCYMSSTSVYPMQLRYPVKETLEIDQAIGVVLEGSVEKGMSKVKCIWQAREGITPDKVRSGKALN